ncbi:uncharacterized protein LOC117535918 [Gymnodraco acuticeps]|uniref:Uncharacterized protein LOC117535918 n=1 Tax=Gymnodraco acuticeps TaxID=8218 RepID=A0A6P8TE62_GYMAC|nr:uncharacterized protein LOC117535918 [Gymnodraco acuticeps]
MSEFRRILMSSFLMLLLHFTVTEHHDNDEVTLNCSVTRRGQGEHTVKWLLQGQDVIKVTDKFTGEVQVFLFRPQSSDEDTKPATTPTKTTTTAKPNLNSGDVTRKVTTVLPTTTKSTLKVRPALETTNTASENNQTEQEDKNPGWWWWIIVVIVAVAALTIITVAVIRRKRTQGTRTETDDDMADPEDGVSYASISYTRKTNRKARAHLHDDDEDDAVTYSTVRAPSSSSAASAVPSLLYATINKQRK